MDDDLFAGQFKLDIAIQGKDRSRQISCISDPQRGIRNETSVTIWIKERFLADNVYLERNNTGELRVIKQVLRQSATHSDNKTTRNILSELRAMGRLSRENGLFVQFIGWFQSDEHIFFAMEYCPLGDINQCFDKPLPEKTARDISQQVLQGLAMLHEIKIIHRDIKPENIFVQRKDPIWVKIGDFGVSKHVPLDGTEPRSRVGTPGYVAPEIFELVENSDESSSYTSAVDIWSFGCLLHYMLTKKSPFPTWASLVYYCQDNGKPGFDEKELVANHIGSSAQEFIKELLTVHPNTRPKVSSIDIIKQWRITGVSDLHSEQFHPPEIVQRPFQGANSGGNLAIDYQTIELCRCIKDRASLERVGSLLEQGASADKEYRGYTALHLAVNWGSVDLVEMLLNYGGDATHKTQDHDDSPLHMATYRRDSRIIKLLTSRGADVTAINREGNTTLHLALTTGCDIDILNTLLDSGAPVEAKDRQGRTALNLAICLYQENMARLLIQKKADLNTQDKDGKTPLHHSICSSRISIVFIRYLVEIGADVTLEDNNQRSPLHEAIQSRRQDRQTIISYLVDRIPDYRVRYPEIETPIQRPLFSRNFIGWVSKGIYGRGRT